MDFSSALDMLTGAVTAPSAVRKPLFKVQIGGGAGDGPAGALGGLAAAAGSALGLGGGSTHDPWQAAVISITVETGLAPFVDAVEIGFAAGPLAPTVAVGDIASIALGYEDSSTDLVFSGQVEAVGYGAHGVSRLSVTNGGALLSRLRINQSYEQQSAGDIAKDLLKRVGVDAGSVQDGVQFPYYIVDDRRNAYVHIAELARKCGFIAYLTSDGKMNLAPFTSGQAMQIFTYGTDILALDVIEGLPPVGTASTYGEGVASSQGQDAWSWLLKDSSEIKGASGDRPPEIQVQDRSLRTRDAAQTMADAIFNAAGQLQLSGQLRAPGAHAVQVGRAVEIAGAPQASVNGLYLVRGLRHQFDKRSGFTSLIQVSKAGESGGAASGLAGLAASLL